MISALVGIIQSVFYSLCFTILLLVCAGWLITLFVIAGYILMIMLFSIMETWTDLRRKKMTAERQAKIENPLRADIVSVLVAICSRPLVKLLS